MPHASMVASTTVYLPGPAVGPGIFSIHYTGSQGFNGWSAAPKGCVEKGMKYRNGTQADQKPTSDEHPLCFDERATVF